MTWAYQHDSTHEHFGKFYNCDQMIMYRAIIKAVESNIVKNNAFSYIIPVGTAIQNTRSSPIGDTLTRDGFHLSYMLGRYIAGMTWFCKITGISADNISYVPDQEISEKTVSLAKEAVKAAVKYPFRLKHWD